MVIMMNFTEQQMQAMRTEVTDSQYLVGQAIVMLGVSLDQWPGVAALMFSTGIEKLMKLILLLRVQANVRSYGHDLEKILRAITDEDLWEDASFLHDQLTQKLIEAMNQMSGSGRYRNVDFLQDVDKFVPPADLLMGLINFNMMVEDSAAPISRGPLDQLVATMWNREKIVRALYRWMRAVSRTLASPSDNKWDLCGPLADWIYGSEYEFMIKPERSGMPPVVVDKLKEREASI